MASTAWATSTGSFAAPDTAMRTLAICSAVAPGTPDHAAHMVGGPETIVTPCRPIDSSAETGSNRSTSSTVEPANSDTPSTTFSPKMWNSGSTPKTTSSELCESSLEANA